MKKSIYLFLFTVCAMLHVTALSAQEAIKFKDDGYYGGMDYIPKCLTKAGAAFVSISDEYQGMGNVKIYDANFEEIASFVQDYNYVVRKSVKEARKEEHININYKEDFKGNIEISYLYSRYVDNPTLDISDTSYENVVKMWLELDNWDVFSPTGSFSGNFYKLTSDTIFYPKESYGYYYPEILGEKYPRFIAKYVREIREVYDEETGSYKKILIGDIVIQEMGFDSDITYTGDWEIVSETYDTLKNGICYQSFVNMDERVIASSRNRYSQNFFNDDENFETLVSVYIPNGTEVYSESDRDRDGEIDKRTVLTKFDRKIAVYSNGSFSHYLNNKYMLFECQGIVMFGDNKYLNLQETINGEVYNVFYRINNSTNSIEQVGEPVRAKMSVRNEVVAIEFKEPVKEQCELIVSDATGKQYEKIFVEAGSANVNYDTRALAPGIYNFTVASKGKVVESGKIVVR